MYVLLFGKGDRDYNFAHCSPSMLPKTAEKSKSQQSFVDNGPCPVNVLKYHIVIQDEIRQHLLNNTEAWKKKFSCCPNFRSLFIFFKATESF